MILQGYSHNWKINGWFVICKHFHLDKYNFLPNNKILDQSRLKGFEDHKTSVTQKLKSVFGMVKTSWEKEKMLITMMASKGILHRLWESGLCGKKLRFWCLASKPVTYHTTKVKAISILKAFASNKLNINTPPPPPPQHTHTHKRLLWVENIAGKEENAGYHNFSISVVFNGFCIRRIKNRQSWLLMTLRRRLLKTF